MKKPPHRLRHASRCLYLIAGFLAFSQPIVAAPEDNAKPATAGIPKSRTPMMDILVLELLKGEPINLDQARQVINDEFGPIWNGKNREQEVPTDGEEMKNARHHTGTYLTAVKASLLDPENHRGWPVGYGKMRDRAMLPLILSVLKEQSLTPMDKVNRTMVNYAIITPALICGDMDALKKSDEERAEDWPGDSYIAKKAVTLKAWAKSVYLKK